MIELLHVRVALAADFPEEIFQIVRLHQSFFELLGYLLERGVLVQALHEHEEVVMQSPGALLRLDGSEQSVDATGNASHCFRGTAQGILTGPRGLRAVRAFRTHPHAQHCGQDGSDLHEERVGCGQGVFRKKQTPQIVPWYFKLDFFV